MLILPFVSVVQSSPAGLPAAAERPWPGEACAHEVHEGCETVQIHAHDAFWIQYIITYTIEGTQRPSLGPSPSYAIQSMTRNPGVFICHVSNTAYQLPLKDPGQKAFRPLERHI